MFQRCTPAILVAGIFVLATAPLDAEQPDAQLEVLATFDYPTAGTQTSPQGINEHGDVSGLFIDASGATRGFIRFRDGGFSPPLIDPNDTGNFTQGRTLNNNRVVCGYYSNLGTFHGFFFSGQAYTTYDVPSATNTAVSGINDAGDFSGEYTTPTEAFVAFANLGGTVVTIEIPGATTSSAFELNNAGEIVGFYMDATGLNHGFYRDPSGALTFPLDFPGATTTFPFGISERSVIVGRYVDAEGVNHGFALRLPDRFVTIDFPGAVFTSLNGINRDGVVCGRYDDGSGIQHGFIGRIR